MAAMPAYRYDYTGSAQPVRREHEAPQSPRIHVVRGRKTSVNPPISNFAVTAIKVLIVAIVGLLVIGFIRVGIASAAYSTASQASSLRTEISDARTTGEALVIQESQIVADVNTKSVAMSSYNLVEPGKATTIYLAPDVVATNADGDLSLSQSVANATAQG